MAFETIDIKDKKNFQALNIPKKWRIKDNKAYLKKVGNVLYVIPFNDPWATLFEGVDSFTSDYMEDREQPQQENREPMQKAWILH